MYPLSVQLYSLREESKKDFVEVIKRVSRIGYAGVEPAGFYHLSPKEFRSIVEGEGMKVSSTHGPWAKPENLNEVIDTAGILGIDLVACGFGPDFFTDRQTIQKTADTVNSMVETLGKAGLTLFIHNHWWEFEKIDGRIKHDLFAELAPKVAFEIDAYWASNFQANDPAEQVSNFKSRTPLIHIKDGPLIRDEAMLALGTGKMNIPAIVAAADPKVLRWIVVELDKCDTDMFEAIEASYQYMIDSKLASGRR